MTVKRPSIDRLSALTARQAQAEMALLRGDIRKLRGRISNMDSLGRQPTIRAKRTKTKTTKTTSLWDLLADFGVTESIGDSATDLLGTGGGYASRTQSSSAIMKFIADADRIR